MKIGFFLVDTKTLESGCGYLCAEALTRTAREHMPGVPVFHFTDETSRPVDGVDGVIRRPKERMARLRMAHQADCTGEWLFVDTDVLFQADVRPVFKNDFDVAIAVRDWAHLKPASGFTERMPYNSGVMFSRCPQFWVDVYQKLCTLPKDEQKWMGDQIVICDLIAANVFRVAMLPGLRYNFPPKVDEQDAEGLDAELEAAAAILHFKGPKRKPMMLRRIHKELLACV